MVVGILEFSNREILVRTPENSHKVLKFSILNFCLVEGPIFYVGFVNSVAVLVLFDDFIMNVLHDAVVEISFE